MTPKIYKLVGLSLVILLSSIITLALIEEKEITGSLIVGEIYEYDLNQINFKDTPLNYDITYLKGSGFNRKLGKNILDSEMEFSYNKEANKILVKYCPGRIFGDGIIQSCEDCEIKSDGTIIYNPAKNFARCADFGYKDEAVINIPLGCTAEFKYDTSVCVKSVAESPKDKLAALASYIASRWVRMTKWVSGIRVSSLLPRRTPDITRMPKAVRPPASTIPTPTITSQEGTNTLSAGQSVKMDNGYIVKMVRTFESGSGVMKANIVISTPDGATDVRSVDLGAGEEYSYTDRETGKIIVLVKVISADQNSAVVQARGYAVSPMTGAFTATRQIVESVGGFHF